jgi:ABC-2 type transport system ATP-binding protein
VDDTAISVKNVSKNFLLPHERTTSVKSGFTGVLSRRNRKLERQQALSGIDFDVKEGEFFGIVGRNGSGKSTLLKIIAGIYQPTDGQVVVRGKLVPFIELGVGFNPELTGRENIYLNGALLGFSKKEIDNLYDSIVAFAELERFMDQKLKNYSSGMQVRLAFSMAIRSEADVLLVDEVLAVGDADFQRKCFSYFRTLKRDKKTVIFVSHDMSAIQQYCDRVILIDNSRLVSEGAPAIIASKYNRLFIEQEPKRKQPTTKVGPSGEERWGDGTATFKKVEASVSSDKKTIVIVATCHANEDIEYPIFGFSIKNQLLQQLIGTNTVRKHINLEPMIKGQTVTIRWEIPNILNEGEHYIDCTIAHEDPTTVGDRWPDAATLIIRRDENNPYIVYSPEITFTEERTHKG